MCGAVRCGNCEVERRLSQQAMSQRARPLDSFGSGHMNGGTLGLYTQHQPIPSEAQTHSEALHGSAQLQPQSPLLLDDGAPRVSDELLAHDAWHEDPMAADQMFFAEFQNHAQWDLPEPTAQSDPSSALIPSQDFQLPAIPPLPRETAPPMMAQGDAQMRLDFGQKNLEPEVLDFSQAEATTPPNALPEMPPSGSSKRARQQKSPLARRRNLPKTTAPKALACPYWKKDRVQYHRCIKGVKRIKDVKQHLRRCHVKPEQCDRCGKCFGVSVEDDNAGNDEEDVEAALREHLREGNCKVDDFQPAEGLTPRQLSAFGSYANRLESTEEQWYSMWRTIFPGLKAPSSPFAVDKWTPHAAYGNAGAASEEDYRVQGASSFQAFLSSEQSKKSFRRYGVEIPDPVAFEGAIGHALGEWQVASQRAEWHHKGSDVANEGKGHDKNGSRQTKALAGLVSQAIGEDSPRRSPLPTAARSERSGTVSLSPQDHNAASVAFVGGRGDKKREIRLSTRIKGGASASKKRRKDASSSARSPSQSDDDGST